MCATENDVLALIDQAITNPTGVNQAVHNVITTDRPHGNSTQYALRTVRRDAPVRRDARAVTALSDSLGAL
jgi:hypothetical protein